MPVTCDRLGSRPSICNRIRSTLSLMLLSLAITTNGRMTQAMIHAITKTMARRTNITPPCSQIIFSPSESMPRFCHSPPELSTANLSAFRRWGRGQMSVGVPIDRNQQQFAIGDPPQKASPGPVSFTRSPQADASSFVRDVVQLHPLIEHQLDAPANRSPPESVIHLVAPFASSWRPRNG